MMVVAAILCICAITALAVISLYLGFERGAYGERCYPVIILGVLMSSADLALISVFLDNVSLVVR